MSGGMNGSFTFFFSDQQRHFKSRCVCTFFVYLACPPKLTEAGNIRMASLQLLIYELNATNVIEMLRLRKREIKMAFFESCGS